MAAEGQEKFKNGLFQAVVEQCAGCERIIAQDGCQYCDTYISPAAKWRHGMCNFATHAKPEVAVVTVRVNPLKASKRAARRK